MRWLRLSDAASWTLVTSLLLGQAAGAASLTFTPSGQANTGHVVCEFPLPRLGVQVIPNGTASIRGNEMAVYANSQMFGARPWLRGTVLRSEAEGDGGTCSVTGLVLFQDGPGMNHVDNPQEEDLVFRSEGALRGRIVGVSGHRLMIQTGPRAHQEVDISSIKLIRSPRAFIFNLAVRGKVDTSIPFKAEVQSASLRPTSIQTVLPAASVVPEEAAKYREEVGIDLDDSDEGPTLRELYREAPLVPFWGGRGY